MSRRTYYFLFILLVFLAATLRFWNFPNRVTLFGDSARDTVLAQAAVAQRRLPLTGSFSSAGPFVFGPLFYWYIMAFYFVAPKLVFSPWYGIAVLSVFLCMILADAARQLSGRTAGILTGLLAAMSPAQVRRANGLTQHSLVGIAVAVAVWSTVVYARKKRWIWAFTLGMGVGVAVNLHYQALSLLILGGIVFLKQWKNWFKLIRDGVAYFFGVILTMLPLLYWDAGQQWANLRNFLDYIFIGQYRIFISRRWLTFGLKFLPEAWGSIVGGYNAAMVLIAIIGVIVIWSLWRRRQFPSMIGWFLLVLGMQIVVLRYSRVELFEGYLIFIHPLVIFVSGWIVAQGIKLKRLRLVTYLLVISIVVGSAIEDIAFITRPFVFASTVKSSVETLVAAYPGKKFVPYDYQYRSSEFTYSLSLLLNQRDLIDQNGIPIGVCKFSCPDVLKVGKKIIIVGQGTTYGINDLSYDFNRYLISPEWNDLSPTNTLKEVGFWWEEEPLTSPFSMRKFIVGTLTGN